MGLIQRFYYWIGIKMSWLHYKGIYSYKGLSDDGMQVVTRIGMTYHTDQFYLDGSIKDRRSAISWGVNDEQRTEQA